MTSRGIPAGYWGGTGVETPYAWVRLAVSVLIATIGGVGFWSVVVVLPAVQDEFGVGRADASLPYLTLTIGLAVGGIAMGRLTDRLGIIPPLFIGSLALAVGYFLASRAGTLLEFALIHGVLIGMLGSSATFGPVLADISHWFTRHRGIAVAIAACGTYMAGAVWPPIIQHFVEGFGWRSAYAGIGGICLVTILPLSLLLVRRRPTVDVDVDGLHQPSTGGRPAALPPLSWPLSPGTLQTLLVVAGISCCIAMAMPQVHIVALCVDLGYGSGRGAQLLSVMLASGIVSRLAFGFMADRFGPLPTLLLSSTLQALSLLMFIPFDGLAPLFMVSLLFGLAQGGIVPTYAAIIREYFAPEQAGARIGLTLSATLLGMAVGGWMSGAIYDLTLNYDAAFLNGFLWNVLNVAIAVYLLFRLGPRRTGRGAGTVAAPV
jgi:MFS family permease